MRCLEKQPQDRPISALAIAAALPGIDLLAAALAGNETPSPEMIAAASPVRRYCVSYSVAGSVAEWCEERIRGDPPDCYRDAEVGKRLPSSCARHSE